MSFQRSVALYVFSETQDELKSNRYSELLLSCLIPDINTSFRWDRTDLSKSNHTEFQWDYKEVQANVDAIYYVEILVKFQLYQEQLKICYAKTEIHRH